MVAIIVSAFLWAKSTHHFDLSNIKLNGYNYLQKEEVLQKVELPRYAELTEIDLVLIQENLEGHPYIKAARISRDFPSSLCIDIIERSPLAYINHSPFLLIDGDAVVLPTKNGNLEFDIPTLSGFNHASELYPVGETCLSQKVQEAVKFLNVVRREFPDLYEDISEFTINTMDEYVLCLSQYPTKVYLGAELSAWQIQLLQQFNQTIAGIRSIHDYKYVDLRYKNQIVVKEKV